MTMPRASKAPLPSRWASCAFLTACAAVTMLLPGDTAAAQAEPIRIRDVQTIDDVCLLLPHRVATLFEALDLERPELAEVKAAHNAGDLPRASSLLVDHFSQVDRDIAIPMHLSHNNATDARNVLRDTFTFYEATARVPRLDTGGLDWRHDGPENDMEWRVALNRHFHLVSLLKAWQETGDVRFVQCINDHIIDWAASHDAIWERRRGDMPWGRGLEVAIRGRHWAAILYALRDEPALTPAARLLLLSRLPEHARYLHELHAARGNWIAIEMLGLSAIALACPEFRQSETWLDYAAERMSEQFTAQVYPDGTQDELSSWYHWVTTRQFDDFIRMLRSAGRPLPDGMETTVEGMFSYLAYAMRPDGANPLNNNGDRFDFRRIVLDAARRYSRPDWTYIATNGREGEKPDGGPSALFPWAGQMISRSGWDSEAHWSYFEIGPWGTGHQHDDHLHLSVHAYGRDVLVDSGRFAYRGELARFRPFGRSSHAHNVVIIDGHGQAPGPRRTNEPVPEHRAMVTETFDYARSAFDQFEELAGSAKHTRAMMYVRGKYWIVIDRVTTDRPRTIDALWRWHPDCTVVVDGQSVASTDEGEGNLRIVPAGIDWEVQIIRGQYAPSIQGWYSEAYGKVEPNAVAQFRAEIESDATFAWLLLPGRGLPETKELRIIAQDDEQVTVKVIDERDTTFYIIPIAGEGEARISPQRPGDARP